MPTYVIEHMESDESDGSFPPWVSLEYSQMLQLASPSQVIFSSLSSQSVSSLGQLLQARGATKASYRAETSSILELVKAEGVDLSKVCLLDPKAEKEMSVEDRQQFEWFLFGGILGDDPPRDRTGELRKLGFPTRHLGPVQMTTDTALGVTKIVVQDQIPLNKIPFVNHPTIRFNKIESVEVSPTRMDFGLDLGTVPNILSELTSGSLSAQMPFRYVADTQGEPILPKGMRELLREDMDKGFDNFDDDDEEQLSK